MTTEPNHAAARAAAQEQARRWINTADMLILDTETTGLDSTAEIVQIAAIWLSDGSTAFDSLVRPTRPIPAAATAIHGITDAMVVDAPTFGELLPRLRTLLGSVPVLIYNAPFDERLMEQSLRACGIHSYEVPVFGADQYIDVMESYSAWCGEWSEYHGNYRWQRLPGGDHTALGDCRATREVILDMADLPEAHTITVQRPRSMRYRWETDRRTVESFAADLLWDVDYTQRRRVRQWRAALAYAQTQTPAWPGALGVDDPQNRGAEHHVIQIVRAILSNGRQTKAGILTDLRAAIDHLDTRRAELETQIRQEQRG